MTTDTSTTTAPAGSLIKTFLPGVVLGFVLGVVGTFIVLTLSERPGLNIDVDPTQRTVGGVDRDAAAPSVTEMTEDEVQAMLDQRAAEEAADNETEAAPAGE